MEKKGDGSRKEVQKRSMKVKRSGDKNKKKRWLNVRKKI